MDIVVITCVWTGTALLCLPSLAHSPSVNVKAVFFASDGSPKTLRYYWRRVKKVLQMGPLGAWNARRMRRL